MDNPGALQLPVCLKDYYVSKVTCMTSHRAIVVSYQAVVHPWGPCFGTGWGGDILGRVILTA